MPLKKIFHKPVHVGLLLFVFGFSALALADENRLDAQIEKILEASQAERPLLVKQLKDEISKQKYNHTEDHKMVKKSSTIDEKIENRKSKFLQINKCCMGKCGMGKCNTNSAPKQIVSDHNISCNSQ